MTHRGVLVVLLAVLALGTSVAQDWRGDGRIGGVVRDAVGDVLEGATVSLFLWDDPAQGPPPVRTSSKGRWAVPGIKPGVWKLVIEAEGHITSYGRVVVRESGPTPPVHVRLRSLEEVSPSASEGNRTTVIEWIERGDTLLGQGRYAEARAEYDKALRALPPAERPAVLQTLAHVHFLEGNVDLAFETLQQALRLAPSDQDLRALLVEVAEEAGREQDATRFLAVLDPANAESPPESPAASLPDDLSPSRRPSAASPPDRPPLPPEPGRTGRYRTTFGRRTPLSELEAIVERYGVERASIEAGDPGAETLVLNEESFEVYVPEAYRPDTPYGLLVWVSPTAFGGFEQADTLAVLDKLRLIAVGANRSGNERPAWQRVALALEAAQNVRSLYRIDERRVYAAGYSGGGRIATGLAMLYPEVFQGGFFFFGCSHYLDMPVSDRPGAHWPAAFARPPRSKLKELKQAHRFVLLTGELDFNRQQTFATFESLLKEGFRHVTYLEIPGVGHYDRVGPSWLEKGFEALDRPLDSGEN